MKKIVFDECPYCGSKLLVYGYQSEQCAFFSDIRGGVFGSPVEHTICQDCGSVIYSRVTRPDIFKDYVDPTNKPVEKKETPKPKKESILEIIVDDEDPKKSKK